MSRSSSSAFKDSNHVFLAFWFSMLLYREVSKDAGDKEDYRIMRLLMNLCPYVGYAIQFQVFGYST